MCRHGPLFDANRLPLQEGLGCHLSSPAGRNLHSDILVRTVFDRRMDGPASLPDAEEIRPFRLCVPERPFSPVIFTSAHSGSAYSADLMENVRLCAPSLRRSEDCFVDDL